MIVSPEIVTHAVHLACRAPSFHNSQPWRWVFADGILHLYLDRDRLVATDLAGRQALISCGAVLDHCQVAMAAAGWHSEVSRFPSPDDTNHLAMLRFEKMATITDGHRQRANAILMRRSDRLPLTAPLRWQEFAIALEARLHGQDAFVDVVDTSDHDQLAEATELFNVLRLYDVAYNFELNWWTRPLTIDAGIPYSALPSAAEHNRVKIGRTFPASSYENRRPHITSDQSRILVISSRDENARSILHCGETLSKVLLEATLVGFATCTITHLTEQMATANLVRSLTGRPLPEAIVRVGMAPPMQNFDPPTPRRSLSQVLTVES